MRKIENSNPKGKAPSTKPAKEFMPIIRQEHKMKREIMRKYGFSDEPSTYDIEEYLAISNYGRMVARRYTQIFGITTRYPKELWE